MALKVQRKRKQRGSLYKQSASENWYAKYRCPESGKVVRRTMRTTDKALARQRLDEILTPVAPEPKPSVSGTVRVQGFSKAAQNWLAVYESRPISDSGKARARRIVETYFQDAFGSLTMAHIKPRHIRQYFGQRFGQGARYNTVRRERQFLSGIFQIAVEDGLMRYNVIESCKLERPAKEQNTRTALTVEQFEAVLAHVKSDVHKNIFRAYFWTGARKAELIAAEHGDIIVNGGGRQHLVIRADSNKRGKSRKVLLTAPALEAIEALREHAEADKLLPSAKHHNDWYNVLRAAAIAAGWDMETNSIGIHSLRHSFCSHWANTPGIPLPWVQAWAGHSDLRVTSTYIHIDESTMDATMTELGY